MLTLAFRRPPATGRFGPQVIPPLLAVLLAACAGDDATAPRPSFSGNGPNGKNATVRITPAGDTLDALQSPLQLAANVDVSWSSLTPGVTSVDAAGRVLSIGPGLGLIQALGVGGRKADTAEILVRQLPASLQVSPDVLELDVGAQGQLTAVTSDANGYPIADAFVAWVSDQVEVATVSADGLVSAVDSGTTTVRAILGALSDAASVTVPAPANPYP